MIARGKRIVSAITGNLFLVAGVALSLHALNLIPVPAWLKAPSPWYAWAGAAAAFVLALAGNLPLLLWRRAVKSIRRENGLADPRKALRAWDA